LENTKLITKMKIRPFFYAYLLNQLQVNFGCLLIHVAIMEKDHIIENFLTKGWVFSFFILPII